MPAIPLPESSTELEKVHTVEVEDSRPRPEFDLTTIVTGGLLRALDPEAADSLADGVRAAGLRHKIFLTLREAADYSGLPLKIIRRMIDSGALPAAKAGGWRIKRTYLEALELRHLRKLERADR